MNEIPETKYARSGDLHIAYQVSGDGPIDAVVVSGWVSHVEMAWELPQFRRFWERLASFSRLVVLDKRGTGASDRVSGVPTLEDRMDDVRAVMDAVGSEQAAVLGWFEASPMCALFAATFPERTRALVLGGAMAKWACDDDFPWGPDPEILKILTDSIEDAWGLAATLGMHSPTAAADPEFLAWWKRYERMSASPGAAAALLRMNAEIDARDVLPAIRVPTLVVHRRHEPTISLEGARWVADHIPGARFAVVPGQDALPYAGDFDPLVDEIQEFLTGVRAAPVDNRILATVMFTDIVDSTKRASELGDRAWRELLDRHDAAVRRQIERFQGREVTGTGDGFLATFDGPARAIQCARAVRENLAPLGLDVRAGLHTGEVERRGHDVGGIAVHIGARVAALAGPGEVLTSSTVKDLVVGSGIPFTERGTHQLKGVPDDWRLFAVQT
jgi:class 3 adenylate cyclase/pimeloyl-ACP methyl ester carboxylesterase